jgi:mannose-6-phosphate isomerase-like protein (cupin superfamily)
VAAYVRRIAAFDAEPSVSHPSSAGNGHAELLQFPSGDTVRILVDGKTSEGSFSVLDCTHVAGPTERHIHADAHKSVFVLAGRYRFVIGDEALDLSPGDEVFIGRGVATTSSSASREGGRSSFSRRQESRSISARSRSWPTLRRRHRQPCKSCAGGTTSSPSSRSPPRRRRSSRSRTGTDSSPSAAGSPTGWLLVGTRGLQKGAKFLIGIGLVVAGHSFW